MHEQSSNLSERSNFFALSSESSRNSQQPNPKKQHYSAFIKKVKHLLQAENDDLDQLYRKVEIIVRKYFHDHKIVEFSDIYEHIAALKTNSSKMNGIVALLERRIIKEEPQRAGLVESRKSNKSNKREEETQTNFKEVGAKTKEDVRQTKLVDYKESLGSVVTSLHNYELSRPAFHKSDAMTNLSEQSNSTKSAQRREQSTSPDRLNSSFEEYQVRNKQYEQKVRELLGQIRDIKESIREQKRVQPLQSHGYDYSPQLKLELNREERQEIRSETSIIDSCLQKNLTTDTNQTRNQQREVQQDLALKKKLQSIKEKSNQSISNKTIGSTNKIEPEPKQEIPLNNAPINSNSLMNNSPLSSSTKELSVEEKKLLLLKQAQNITKQLSELKSFASQLQIEPNQPPASTDQPSISQKSQLNIFTAIERNNNQILQRISPTISKPMIESNIPSLKHLRPAQPLQLQQSIHINKLQKMVDSSAFSFSDNQSHPPFVQMRPITRSNHTLVNGLASGLVSNERPRPSSSSQNIRSSGTILPSPYPQQVSTIRYVYDPYATNGSAYGRNTAMHQPTVHFAHQPINNVANQSSHNASGLRHNYSQTSIMRGRAHQIPTKAVKISYEGKYSHLRQPSRSSSNIQQSQVKPMTNYSLGVGRPTENNSSLLRKKGINMMSPHPFLHR